MADELKRVGIKLTAEGAEDFKGSLKDISAEMKNNRAELKLAQSQYDSHTSVTQKLADKQKYLAQQTALYEDKLEILNAQLEAEKRAEDQDTEAIAKKEREIKECQTQLNKYKNELEDTTKALTTHSAQLKEWGKQLENVGGRVTSVGKGLTKSVTAPIAAVGAAGIAAFKEVDVAMDTLITKTGARGEALEDMEQRVRNLATSIPTDFETAGTAIGEVNTRFGLTGQELEDLSAAFIKFSQINGTDVNSSIDTVQSAMQAFGVDTSKASNVLNMLNKAGQDTGASVDKLASDLVANATAFQEMGFGINQSINFLSQLDKSGLEAGTVMSGLKKALQNAAKEGKPMSTALKDLQKNMASAKSDTEAMQMAVELFGGKAGPQLAKAIQEGTVSFDDLENIMLGFSGSVESTFEATLDPLDEFTTLSNEAKVGLADLGEQIQVAALPLIEALADGVKGLVEWFTNLDDDTKQTIIKFAGLAAVIGPVVMVIGTLITSIGAIVGAIGAAMPVITAVVGVLTGPVALAIGAVIAAGVLLYKNWDTIKEKAGELAEKAKEKWDDMKTAAGEKFEAIKTTVSEKWDDMKSTTETKLGDLVSKVRTKYEEIRKKADEKIEGVKSIFQKGIDYLKGLFDFEWELPKIKLPHFSITGEWSWSPPSTPSLGVEWYAKAMNTGVILNEPTIFGMSGNTLLGAGEAGPEVVAGASSLYNMIRSAVSEESAAGETVINVYGAPGQDVRALAQIVADLVNHEVRAKKAVHA